jgi:hypothetical protein
MIAMSTFSRTNSVASSGKRAIRPSAQRLSKSVDSVVGSVPPVCRGGNHILRSSAFSSEVAAEDHCLAIGLRGNNVRFGLLADIL